MSSNLGTGKEKETDYNLLTGKKRIRAWRDGNCVSCKNDKQCPELGLCEKGERQVYDKEHWKKIRSRRIKLVDFFSHNCRNGFLPMDK